MQSNEIKKIMGKFNELKSLDSQTRRQENNKNQTTSSDIILNPFKVNGFKQKKQQHTNSFKKDPMKQQQIIGTQSDIVKQLVKLKPYLDANYNIRTTQELEELKNSECSKENYKMMCQMTIIENRKLCKVLEKQSNLYKLGTQIKKTDKETEGWVFQIFYRSGRKNEDLSKRNFSSGYAVMTEMVDIFQSLIFEKNVGAINPSQITNVKYLENGIYQIMRVQQGINAIQIGFLNSTKLNLFDRMLFLQKTMSRSTSTRLFQNQLIRNIYQQY